MKRLLRSLSLALLLAAPAHAYFEEVAVGARGLAMGFGSIASVGDVSAHYWNAAALTRLSRGEASVDYAKPYGLTDLNVGGLAVAAPVGPVSLGAGWHHLGLTDSYAEDLFPLAVAHRVSEHLRLPRGHVISAGLAGKVGRIGFTPFANPEAPASTVDYGQQSRTSLDASLLYETPWRVDLAWVGRDLLEPRYEFIPGTGGQRLAARQEIAASVRWNRESTISLGWSQLAGGRTSLSAGIEVTFFNVFAIRSSISNLSNIVDTQGSPNELDFNGGFGVFHKGYHVDATATTDHDLGASYRVTLRAPFPGGAR
jgi:hypothetical protein